MTLSAWIMLGLTWGIVLFFAGKFFLMALRTPPAGEDGE